MRARLSRLTLCWLTISFGLAIPAPHSSGQLHTNGRHYRRHVLGNRSAPEFKHSKDQTAVEDKPYQLRSSNDIVLLNSSLSVKDRELYTCFYDGNMYSVEPFFLDWQPELKPSDWVLFPELAEQLRSSWWSKYLSKQQQIGNNDADLMIAPHEVSSGQPAPPRLPIPAAAYCLDEFFTMVTRQSRFYEVIFYIVDANDTKLAFGSLLSEEEKGGAKSKVEEVQKRDGQHEIHEEPMEKPLLVNATITDVQKRIALDISDRDLKETDISRKETDSIFPIHFDWRKPLEWYIVQTSNPPDARILSSNAHVQVILRHFQQTLRAQIQSGTVKPGKGAGLTALIGKDTAYLQVLWVDVNMGTKSEQEAAKQRATECISAIVEALDHAGEGRGLMEGTWRCADRFDGADRTLLAGKVDILEGSKNNSVIVEI